MDEPTSSPIEGNDKTWICATCGNSHSDVPLSFAANFPDTYANLKSEDRDLRGVIGRTSASWMRHGFLFADASKSPFLVAANRFFGGFGLQFVRKYLTRSQIVGIRKEEKELMAHSRAGSPILCPFIPKHSISK